MSTPTDKPKKTFLETLGKYVVPADQPPAPPPPAVEPTPAPAVPAAAEPEPSPAAAPAEPTPVAPVAEPSPVKPEPPPRPKKSDPLPPVADTDLQAAAAPAEPTTPKPFADVLGYVPTRTEERYLETLREGVELDPKYQAVLDREIDRMKAVNEFSKKWELDNPDAEAGDILKDPKYKRFLRDHPPAIDHAEHETLRENLIEERATRRAEERLNAKMSPQLKKVAEMEAKPLIEAANSAVEAAVLGALPQDDYLGEAAKIGLEAVGKVPVEGRIVTTVVARAQGVVEEFVRLRRGLTLPDNTNPMHKLLQETVTHAARIFEEQGGAERIRDGRRFVAPAIFARLTPAAREKHFTFTEDDVIGILTQQAAETAKQLVSETRKEAAEAENFRASRKPKGSGGKPTEAAPPATPPKPSPAMAPSPAAPPSPQPAGPKNPRLARALGLDRG